MKKFFATLAIVVLVASLITSMTVMASSSASQVSKKKTPGAQATVNASRKETPKAHGNQNNQNKNQPVHYSGIIAASSATSLTLTLENQSTVDFMIDSNTQIKIPSLGNSATTGNLIVGQKVTIRAMKNESGTLVALSISVVPGKPILVHRVGIVTEYTPAVTITIMDKYGKTFTFLLTDQTKILPADRADKLVVGSFVTIICPRDVTGGSLTATGIVVHPANVEPTETVEGTYTETPTPTITETPTETPTETATIPAI